MGQQFSPLTNNLMNSAWWKSTPCSIECRGQTIATAVRLVAVKVNTQPANHTARAIVKWARAYGQTSPEVINFNSWTAFLDFLVLTANKLAVAQGTEEHYFAM